MTYLSKMSAVLATLILAMPLAWGHPHVKVSAPEAGAMVHAAVTEVVVIFTETVNESFSSIVLTDAGGKSVTDNKVHTDPANLTILKLEVPKLAPGEYSVKWVAVSQVNGHRVTGDFKFSVM